MRCLCNIFFNLIRRYTTDHFTYDMGEPQETMYSADMPGVPEQDQPLPEEDRNPSRGGVISFPDLLAPGTRLNQEGQVARFASEYSPYTRRGIRVRSHSPSLLDPNLFRVSRKVR